MATVSNPACDCCPQQHEDFELESRRAAQFLDFEEFCNELREFLPDEQPVTQTTLQNEQV